MRPVLEHVPSGEHLSLFFNRYQKPSFSFPWHYHPQWELTFIIEGAGTAYTGNDVRHYVPNELVLMAPNVHHCWTSSAGNFTQVQSIYVQWENSFLGEGWLEKAEFNSIRTMFARCHSGLLFTDAADLGERLISLEGLAPIKKTLGFVELLHELSTRTAATNIGQATLTSNKSADDKRIAKILEYVSDHYARKITAEEMGVLTNMTPVSFSKYFTRSFNKPFTQFLNEYRISQACSLLISTTLTIEQIGFRCGYHNMSHFHRQFRANIDLTPAQYRQHYRL